MRIKIINPNTSQVMTDRMRISAESVAAAGTTIEAVSPSGGPAAIEGFYDETYAALGLLEEVRKGERDGFDAYVVACFSEAGISAARELAAGPVVGIGRRGFDLEDRSALRPLDLPGQDAGVPGSAEVGDERLGPLRVSCHGTGADRRGSQERQADHMFESASSAEVSHGTLPRSEGRVRRTSRTPLRRHPSGCRSP